MQISIETLRQLDWSDLLTYSLTEDTCRSQIVEKIELPAKLSGDKIRLQQVLVNILKNSLKYSRDGGEIKIYAAYHDWD